MSVQEDFLNATVQSFSTLRLQGEAALEQVDDNTFFAVPGPRNSSLAMIVKHVADNSSRRKYTVNAHMQKNDRRSP